MIQDFRDMMDELAIVDFFDTQEAESVDNEGIHPHPAAADGIVIIIVADINALPGAYCCGLQRQIEDPGIRFDAVHLAGNYQMIEIVDQSRGG